MKIEAVIPAAGLGSRLKYKTAKPLLSLNGRPILYYSLEALSGNKFVKRIIIAVRREHRGGISSALDAFGMRKRVELVAGGDTRSESVENCLKETSPDTDCVLIHDAARPFLRESLLNRCIKEAQKNSAVVCGVPVKATIKRVTPACPRLRREASRQGRGCGLRDADCYEVKETLKRQGLWEIQTPQLFRRELLVRAYKRFKGRLATDDASLVEKLGVKVKVIFGSYFNIKITTAEDLVFAKAILKARSNEGR